LVPIGTIPQNEAQARPLKQIAPERQAEVWQRAVATAPDGQVTAKHVQQVVNEALGKAGRFENELYYPVNNRDQEIYRQPRKNTPDWNEHYGVLHGCQFVSGEHLNQQKRYDAFPLVAVPTYQPGLAIGDAFPAPKESHFEYPVSEKEKIIYLDPQKSWHKPGYYTDVAWVRYSDIEERWVSHIYRYGDFQILPSLLPPTDWLADAIFQPGMQAQCKNCGQVYPYAKWANDGEKLWVCPGGHRKADPLMDIYKQDALPSSQPPKTRVPPPKERRMSHELENVMDNLLCLVDVLDDIRTNRALIEAALKPENIAIYNEEFNYTDDKIDDIVAAATQHLMAWVDLLDEDEDETEEDFDEDIPEAV
jgi:hypothetical protein